MDIIQLTGITLGPLTVTVLLGFTTIALILWHSSRKQSYWKKIGIPFAKPVPVFGNLLEKIFKSLHLIELDRFKKFGRIYGHFEGNRPLLSVAEPEIIRNILVRDSQTFPARKCFESGDKMLDNLLPIIRGDAWKRVRSVASKAFATDKIKKMLDIFNGCSKTLVKNIRETSKTGEPIDAKSTYSAFAMDIIAGTVYSYKVDSYNDPSNKFVTIAKQIFSRKITWRVLVFILCHPFMKLFNISVLPPKAIKFFTDRILQIIEERKRSGQTSNDYLQMLLDTAQEISDERKPDLNVKEGATENYGNVDSNQTIESSFTVENLSEDELVALCVIFFLAGYVTTASLLSFISYELALNPDVQEKLLREVDEALRTNDGELTYEAIQSMKYLDNVIAETLRLYPPFVGLGRQADKDYILGDTGLTVPKGMIVTIPIYTMHRDPKLFPNPEKFDPDRFSPEERAKQVPYSYLPFGAGPRHCVAIRFALMEVKICLAHVLSNFKIKKCPATKVPVEYDHDIGFLQPKNVPLFMEIRKNQEKELQI